MYPRESLMKEDIEVRSSTFPNRIAISMLSSCNHINRSQHKKWNQDDEGATKDTQGHWQLHMKLLRAQVLYKKIFRFFRRHKYIQVHWQDRLHNGSRTNSDNNWAIIHSQQVLLRLPTSPPKAFTEGKWQRLKEYQWISATHCGY